MMINHVYVKNAKAVITRKRGISGELNMYALNVENMKK